MNTDIKSGWLTTKNVVVGVIGVMVMYFIVSSLVDSRFQALELATKVRISDQENKLNKIAEIAARNGADSVTESIIKDCPVAERVRFDSLLGQLNSGLNKSELTELERLFGRCGSYFSESKSVMVSRLSREVEIYSDYVNQLNAITGNDNSDDYRVENWNKLAKAERKQAESSVDLVRLQDAIITTLLSGKSSESDEMIGILKQVEEVQTSLYEAKKEANELTSTISSS